MPLDLVEGDCKWRGQSRDWPCIVMVATQIWLLLEMLTWIYINKPLLVVELSG